jgi:exonuclease III
MRIIAINVKGMTSPEKASKLFTWAKSCGADVAFLVESHLTTEKCAALQRRFPKSTWYTAGDKGNKRGVTVVLLDNVKFVPDACTVLKSCKRGRFLCVKIEHETASVTLLGVYSPNNNSDAVRHFKKLQKVCEKFKPDVILGDFNKVDDRRDRNPGREEEPRVKLALKELLKTHGYVDGWRMSNPEKRQFTFWQTNQECSASRIDRVYVATQSLKNTSNYTILQKPSWTDHAGIGLEYHARNRVDIGPGLWRLNPKLITNKVMAKALNEYLATTVPEVENLVIKSKKDLTFSLRPDVDPALALKTADELLDGLRKCAEKTQRKIIKGWKGRIKRTTRKILRLDEVERTHKTAKRIKRLKESLENLTSAWEEQRIQSKTSDWRKAGHGLSGDFWKQGKPATTKKPIRGLRKENGKITTKTKAMLKLGRRFYKNLYSKRQTDKECQEKLLNLIPQGNFEETNRPVSVEEVEAVMGSWENGRSPGSSGLNYELFKAYNDKKFGSMTLTDVLTVWVTLLVENTKYGLTMPERNARGYIALMYKKGDPYELKNYRPLSLINVQYKLLTKIIHERLIEPFQACIGPHQSGFMPGRSIFDNIKEVQCMIDVAKQRKEPLFIAFLDQEKAYDRVDHDFLWKALDRYGVPQSLVRCIRGIYKAASSTVYINKHESIPFKVRSGVRQGDPLSCLLFNAVIEVLARDIIREERLTGLVDNEGCKHKVSMFADDTASFMTKLREWDQTLVLYNRYAKATGAALNREKTKIMAVVPDGWNIPNTARGYNIISKTTLDYLGIPVGENFDKSAFWEERLESIRKRIRRWSLLYTGRLARVKVATMELEGTLWHFIRCLPISIAAMRKIQRPIQAFIWKRDENQRMVGKIANRDSWRSREEGGLALLHVQSMQEAIVLEWISKLEKAYKSPAEKRPQWYNLMMELMKVRAPKSYQHAVDRPWAQRFTLNKEPAYPPSIDHFWKIWHKHRDYQPDPETLSELMGIDFWLHPAFKRRNAVQWGKQCWKQMKTGTASSPPVKNVKDLLEMGKNERMPTALRDAARRLVREFPMAWAALLEDAEDLPEGESPQLQMLVTYGDAKYKPINEPNRVRYAHLVQDAYGKGGKTALLEPFRQLCIRDEVDLSEYPEKRIWAMTQDTSIDYSLFSDLYWVLIIGRCETGESWMYNNGNCPLCGVTQTPEHLFWRCPTAVALWKSAKTLWEKIDPEEKIDFPRTWAQLIISGDMFTEGKKKTSKRRRTNIYRRWRCILAEGLWTLWTIRCEWSFEEIEAITVRLCQKRFRQRVNLRVMTDLRRAVNESTPESLDSFRKTWNISNEEEPIEWL